MSIDAVTNRDSPLSFTGPSWEFFETGATLSPLSHNFWTFPARDSSKSGALENIHGHSVMNDLERKIAANSAGQEILRRQMAELSAAIADTDWIFKANGPASQNGEWRSEAERRRRQLNAELSQLQSKLRELDLQSRELQAQRDARREVEQRDQWAGTKRSDLMTVHGQKLQAVTAADAAVDVARGDVARQQERLAECDAADAAVVEAQASLVEIRGRVWLLQTAEARAAENDASRTLASAQENAQRAAAARPHLDAELSRARDALAAAEAAAESARAAETAAHLVVAKFDWNAAVSQLQPAFAAIAAVDRQTAYSLRDAMNRGVPVFDHRGWPQRAPWVHEALH